MIIQSSSAFPDTSLFRVKTSRGSTAGIRHGWNKAPFEAFISEKGKKKKTHIKTSQTNIIFQRQDRA